VYMRPPRGELDDRVLRIIKSVGMIPVMWTTDTQDWRINLGYSYDQSLAELMTGFNIVSNRGVISLHHDIWAHALPMSKAVIPKIKSSNIRTVLTHQCINGPGPYSGSVSPPKPPAKDAGQTGSSANPNRCGTSWASANSQCGPACTSNLGCAGPSLTCYLSLDMKPCQNVVPPVQPPTKPPVQPKCDHDPKKAGKKQLKSNCIWPNYKKTCVANICKVFKKCCSDTNGGKAAAYDNTCVQTAKMLC
jgi:hypothetical protein